MSIEAKTSIAKIEGCVEGLPGRIANSGIFSVCFGKTVTYFYMTPDKHLATKKLIEALNRKEIGVVADVYDAPRTVEFSAVASILPDTDAGCEFQDPTGQKALNEYAEKITPIAIKSLKLPPFSGLSRELNLIVSHDAHTYHHDCFPRQYRFLENNPQFGKALLIHDLTLADWDMAPGTVSGTIFHDPVGNDRFLFTLLPKDQYATMTLEPVNYAEDGVTPHDPGANHLPFHAVLSPEDLRGDVSPGSSKGQRISSVLRGVIPDKGLEELNGIAKELPVNRPIAMEDEIRYPGKGIVISKASPVDIRSLTILGHEEKGNVTLLKVALQDGSIGVQIIKKDGGFNHLKDLLDFQDSDEIWIFNNSSLPEGYKHYPISEDQSDLGCPWMQIYHFPKGSTMKLDGRTFKRFALTPIIELIFRDETSKTQFERSLKPKICTDLFCFCEIQIRI